MTACATCQGKVDNQLDMQLFIRYDGKSTVVDWDSQTTPSTLLHRLEVSNVAPG